MTYYKYQPNSPTDFTNWSKISTELTSYIDELQKKQEAKSEKAKKEAQEAEDRALSRESTRLSIESSKYALDEKKREKAEAQELATLTAQSGIKSKVPTKAELERMNQRATAQDANNPNIATAFATGVGNAAAEQLSVLNSKYKSGEISAAALTVGRNNLTTNTTQLFAAMRDFDRWQNKTAQGIIDGKVSEFGGFVAEQYEGIAGNLNKLAVQFTPEGNMYFAKEGQKADDPLIPATDIFTMPTLEYAPFSVKDYALDFNKGVANYLTLTGLGGTRQDATKRPGYMDYEERELKVVLDDPLKVASILTDNAASDYKFVMDDGTGSKAKSGEDGKTIPVVQTKDGLKPVIDKHHIETARSILKNAINQGMPISETKPPEPKQDPNKLTATESAALQKARGLYGGDQVAFDQAVSQLNLPAGTTVSRVTSGIEVKETKVVGGKTTVSTKIIPKGASFAEFVQAASTFLGAPSLAAPAKEKYYGTATEGTAGTTAKTSTSVTKPPEALVHDKAVATINESTDKGFDTSDEAKAKIAVDSYINQVNSQYTGLQYTFSKKGDIATFKDNATGVVYAINISKGKGNIGQQYAYALKKLNEKVSAKIGQ